MQWEYRSVVQVSVLNPHLYNGGSGRDSGKEGVVVAGVKRREGRESSEAAAREERRGRWERSDEAGGREAAVLF